MNLFLKAPGKRGVSARKAGFTIIELLVVIAIIGILAAIVLATLISGRAKGSDAAVKGDINSARTQTDVAFYSASPNSYAGICSDALVLGQLKGAATADTVGVGNIDSTLTDAGGPTKVTCHVNAGGTAYAIQAPLLSDSNNSWCVDNAGDSKLEVGAVKYLGASATVCP